MNFRVISRDRSSFRSSARPWCAVLQLVRRRLYQRCYYSHYCLSMEVSADVPSGFYPHHPSPSKACLPIAPHSADYSSEVSQKHPFSSPNCGSSFRHRHLHHVHSPYGRSSLTLHLPQTIHFWTRLCHSFCLQWASSAGSATVSSLKFGGSEDLSRCCSSCATGGASWDARYYLHCLSKPSL